MRKIELYPVNNEADLMNAVRTKLSSLGFRVFRVNVGKIKTKDGRYFSTGLPVGFSDLLALKDGRAFFLETKMKPKKPTDAQLNFILQMRNIGCIAGVVYSVEEAIQLCTSKAVSDGWKQGGTQGEVSATII